MSVRRLWLINAAGNAVLLAAIYVWLGIPDRKSWQLAASALLAAVVVFSALWLHTATFAFFRQVEPRKALARIPAFALWVALAIAAIAAVAWLSGYFPRWSAWLGSALTLRLRRPVRPETIQRALVAVAWFAQWIALPALLLPVAGAVSAEGFAGFRRWRPRPRFWLEYVALLAAGLYLPWRLVSWVPEFEALWLQLLSVLVRFAAAWFLAVTAWLLVARAAAVSLRPAQTPDRLHVL